MRKWARWPYLFRYLIRRLVSAKALTHLSVCSGFRFLNTVFRPIRTDSEDGVEKPSGSSTETTVRCRAPASAAGRTVRGGLAR
jgi:hypothetical protein